jgi:uncharacterized membrane protein HdeD (DUF308 family)
MDDTRDLLHRAWHTLAFWGVAGVALALAAFLAPWVTLAGLFLLFGGYLLVDGVLTVAAAIRVHPRFATVPWLMEGALSVVAGVVALFFLPLDATFLGYFLGVWALTTGIVEAWLAFRMRRFTFSGPYWAIGAAISLIIGALLMIRPETVAVSLVMLLGIYAAIFGVAMLAIARSLRNLELRTAHPMGVAVRA